MVIAYIERHYKRWLREEEEKAAKEDADRSVDSVPNQPR
jgi:hypothetical protein